MNVRYYTVTAGPTDPTVLMWPSHAPHLVTLKVYERSTGALLATASQVVSPA